MSETETTLGFIGLGVMGSGMCGNVVKKHPAPVWAFDLDAGALQEQVGAGANKAESVAQRAANAPTSPRRCT